MKKITTICVAFAVALASVSCSQEESPLATQKIVVAYVGSNPNSPLPDPSLMTHINYAFGVVNDSHDGVVIQNEERLHEVSALKNSNEELKIMLSIGGWGAGGFSEMAREDSSRAAFVKHCTEITAEFNLDGIDMDWEYPTSSGSGIESHPSDLDNFTSLIKELRASLGDDKLVTFASVANAKYVDFKAVEPYLDFVNLMTYDMGNPHQGMHHSALYPSSRSRMSVDESVKLHYEAGLPRHKIVVGVPFYARTNTERGYPNSEIYARIDSVYKGHDFLWDSVSMMPYVAHSEDDEMLAVYDNEKSLKLKADYVNEKGLGGMMYWVYGADGVDAPLSKVVWRAMSAQESSVD